MSGMISIDVFSLLFGVVIGFWVCWVLGVCLEFLSRSSADQPLGLTPVPGEVPVSGSCCVSPYSNLSSEQEDRLFSWSDDFDDDDDDFDDEWDEDEWDEDE